MDRQQHIKHYADAMVVLCK